MKKSLFGLTAALMTAACLISGCGEKKQVPSVPEEESSETAEDTAAADAKAESDTAEDKKTDYGPRLSEMDLEDYIVLGEYKGLTVSMDNTEPTEDEVQAYIDDAMKEMAVEEPVTGRPVQMGDVVDIDFEGKKDGVAFDGGTAQGYSLEIGSHSFIEGFEDGLIGAEIGETRDLDLTFPEDYHSADLAGAAVVFTVKINGIAEKKVPELNDETAATLASNIGKEASNVEEYRKAVAETIKEENEESALQSAKGDLVMQVVEGSQISEVPEGIINEQLDVAVMQANSYAAQMGVSTDEFLQQYMGSTLDQYKETYRTYAEEGTKQMLAIYAIAEKEGMTLTAEQVKEELSGYMENMGYTDYDEFINSLEGRVNEEYLYYDRVSQFLYDNANVIK